MHNIIRALGECHLTTQPYHDDFLDALRPCPTANNPKTSPDKLVQLLDRKYALMPCLEALSLKKSGKRTMLSALVQTARQYKMPSKLEVAFKEALRFKKASSGNTVTADYSQLAAHTLQKWLEAAQEESSWHLTLLLKLLLTTIGQHSEISAKIMTNPVVQLFLLMLYNQSSASRNWCGKAVESSKMRKKQKQTFDQRILLIIKTKWHPLLREAPPVPPLPNITHVRKQATPDAMSRWKVAFKQALDTEDMQKLKDGATINYRDKVREICGLQTISYLCDGLRSLLECPPPNWAKALNQFYRKQISSQKFMTACQQSMEELGHTRKQKSMTFDLKQILAKILRVIIKQFDPTRSLPRDSSDITLPNNPTSLPLLHRRALFLAWRETYRGYLQGQQGDSLAKQSKKPSNNMSPICANDIITQWDTFWKTSDALLQKDLYLTGKMNAFLVSGQGLEDLFRSLALSSASGSYKAASSTMVLSLVKNFLQRYAWGVPLIVSSQRQSASKATSTESEKKRHHAHR